MHQYKLAHPQNNQNSTLKAVPRRQFASFRIVSTGKIHEYYDKKTVVTALAGLFKSSPEFAEKLLENGQVIQRGLSKGKAVRMKVILEGCGLYVKLMGERGPHKSPTAIDRQRAIFGTQPTTKNFATRQRLATYNTKQHKPFAIKIPRTLLIVSAAFIAGAACSFAALFFFVQLS